MNTKGLEIEGKEAGAAGGSPSPPPPGRDRPTLASKISVRLQTQILESQKYEERTRREHINSARVDAEFHRRTHNASKHNPNAMALKQKRQQDIQHKQQAAKGKIKYENDREFPQEKESEVQRNEGIEAEVRQRFAAQHTTDEKKTAGSPEPKKTNTDYEYGLHQQLENVGKTAHDNREKEMRQKQLYEEEYKRKGEERSKQEEGEVRGARREEEEEEREAERQQKVQQAAEQPEKREKENKELKKREKILVHDNQLLLHKITLLEEKLAEVNRMLTIEKIKNDIEQATKQRIVEIEAEKNAIQAQYRELTDKSIENTKEIDKQRDQLAQEQDRVNNLLAELERRDQELRLRAAEFEGKVKDWQERIANIISEQTDKCEQATPCELLNSVEEAGDEVAKYEREWKRCQLLTDEAFHKFIESQKSMKERVETLENWLTLMEQQVTLPEAKFYNELLRAIQHINSTKKRKKKCFISYAWNVDKKENTKLQARLIQIKNDLMRAGIEVMLDIQNMEGDINLYMSGGIQQCDRVLLICTPRLKQRIEEVSSSMNNLQKEYHAALARQATNPTFIIPLILEGTRDTSISSSFAHILSLDFSNQVEYRDLMVSLQPKGLIPMILGLDDNLAYQLMLTAYKLQLAALSTQNENQIQK